MGMRSDDQRQLRFVSRFSSRLSKADLKKVAAIVKQREPECGLGRERRYFEPYARRGLGAGPKVVIGDTTEIRLMEGISSGLLEYRLSTLAGPGDVVVIGQSRIKDFEEYRREFLGFTDVEYLGGRSERTRQRTGAALSCLRAEDCYQELLEAASRRSCATLLAHITTGTIWALARRLAIDAGWPMRVAGPLPTLSRLANDKIWFSALARDLLGQEVLPREFAAFGAAALTRYVRKLAQDNSQLVVKVPDSAGAVGNFVISSEDVRCLNAVQTHRFLIDLLQKVKGSYCFPLLVQVWASDALTSPSIQFWIPKESEGSPIVEGIFQQILSAPHGEFAGAVPAELPPEMEAKLTHQGMMLATALQQLGYFGRCSFDSVLAGESIETARLLWIECNARWGGVSVPMTLLNTLFQESGVPDYVIHHAPAPEGVAHSFAKNISRIGNLLWARGKRKGVILLTPSGFETDMEFHFISLAPSTDEALVQADLVIKSLVSGEQQEPSATSGR